MKFKEGETMKGDFEGEVIHLHFKNIENTVLVVSAGDTSNGDSAIMFSPPELPDCLFDALIVNLIRGRAAADRTTSADAIMDRISQIVNTNKFKYRGVQE